MTRKWVVTDIDGTITDADGLLSPPAVDELRALESSGISVGLVSGRPYPGVRLLGEYLGLTGPLIAENGGIGWYGGREFVLGSRLPAENAFAVIASILPVRLTWDTRFRATDVAIERSVNVQFVRDVAKLHELAIEMHVSSIMIHFSARFVTKGAGFRHWLTMADARADDVAVAGDASSDMSLFEAVRTSIAPSNCERALASLASFKSNAPFGLGCCEGINHLRRSGWLIDRY